MDWNELGRVVGPILANNAPTIGGVLGGLIPIPGGSLIGEAMGNLLAAQFGVPPTPDAVGKAILSDPNAAAKITAAETEAAAKWPALAEIAKANAASNAAQAVEINATMRAETAKGLPWYAWRNLYGYSVAFECTLVSLILCFAIVFDPLIFKRASESLSFFLSWYGLRMGLLGYIHNQSTQEKVAAVTGQPPPGLVANVIKAVKGK